MICLSLGHWFRMILHQAGSVPGFGFLAISQGTRQMLRWESSHSTGNDENFHLIGILFSAAPRVASPLLIK